MPAAKPVFKAGSPVYCAGPMFSVADLGEQRQISTTLKSAGFDTYLPQDDGIEVAKVMGKITSGLAMSQAQAGEVMAFARKIVFALDIFQLVSRCRSVVFNMDGRVPDEGSVVEAAIAYAVCKPVITFKTTPITILGGFDNPMVEGLTTTWQYVDDMDLIPAALAAAVADRPVRKKSSYCRHLDAVIALGASVWEEIDLIHQAPDLPPEKLYEQVHELEQLWSAELAAAF